MSPGILEAVRAALAQYGLKDARLTPLRPGGFKHVIRVSDPQQGDFVLNLYGLPPAHGATPASDPRAATETSLRAPAVLRSQMAWLSALARGTDLLVPEPVATSGGALVARVGEEGTPRVRHSTLVRWVPGDHKRRKPSDADLGAVGYLVASLHAHAERYVSPEGAMFPRWDWDWPFGRSAPVWAEGPTFYSEQEMSVFREASRRVRASLGELGYGGEAFGLVHRDLKLGNLVFSEGLASGVVAGAVDFDLSGSGHYLFDLAVVRRSVRRLLPADRRETGWAALLGSYEHERPLPATVRERLDRYLLVFDAMQRVAGVNRGLGLLGSDGPEAARAAGRGPAFLHDSLTWLRERIGYLAAIPCSPDVLNELPRVLAETLGA